jgi:hypothetical protein
MLKQELNLKLFRNTVNISLNVAVYRVSEIIPNYRAWF